VAFSIVTLSKTVKKNYSAYLVLGAVTKAIELSVAQLIVGDIDSV